MNYAIIVAGGKGLRMGGAVPKQFLPIGGLPVLMRTIEQFHRADSSLQIIVVLPANQHDYWKKLCGKYHFNVAHKLAEGGATRFHSVKNGLQLIADGEEGVVGVHDGVRPFASTDMIRRCYEAAVEHEAVIPVVKVVDTLRLVSNDGSSHTVQRSLYRQVQTPQTFVIGTLKQAYGQAYSDKFTDDASVVESLGIQVSMVEGERSNIKLTTPFDLCVAKALLSEEKGNSH